MRPDAEEMARLWDMLDAARTAVEFTKGVGFEDFLAHPVFAYFRMDSRQRPDEPELGMASPEFKGKAIPAPDPMLHSCVERSCGRNR